MELDADCLRWAKIENLERLLRALGTPLPLRSYDANLYRMRLVRMAARTTDSGTLKKVVDMSDFNTVSFPRASKPHKCVECRGVIEPGTRHARIAGATDGYIWVERECLDCKALSDELWSLLDADNLHPEDGPTFGDLACWIHENDEDERLSPEGRARLKALDERLSPHG